MLLFFDIRTWSALVSGLNFPGLLEKCNCQKGAFFCLSPSPRFPRPPSRQQFNRPDVTRKITLPEHPLSLLPTPGASSANFLTDVLQAQCSISNAHSSSILRVLECRSEADGKREGWNEIAGITAGPARKWMLTTSRWRSRRASPSRELARSQGFFFPLFFSN